MLDGLTKVITYRSLWALCSTNKKGQMRAVYYCSCLVFGRQPLWGCWNLNGRFQHFGAGRDELARLHPNLTWRRVMSRWQLVDDTDSIAKDRRKALELELEQPLPKTDDPVAERLGQIVHSLHS